MAGLSLRCGDCGLQLRSVEEAQEHAELSGHANFSESTEAVLNLVCAECGKPCRSKTETDLHTKRTGHTQFQDKTLEAAKPVVLEVPKQPINSETPESQDAEEGELVIPEVNKDLLAELEGMGFSNGKSIRALYVSGASDLETAINWIVEHENDPDIDEIPRVSAKQASKQKIALAPEEAKAKLQELRERARKKKEEEERRMEREREKERIRIGKELLEAKRKEEDNERQRILMLRKAEKEEEKRAREKIRQKLEEDKAERRRKLGLPAEDPKPAASVSPVAEKKSALPIKPASRAEQMRDCLRTMKQVYKDDDAKVKKAFQTLLTFVGNVVRSPDEEKYRKIRLSNQSFQERVGAVEGGLKFLELCGFEKDQAGEFMFLSRDKVDVVLLNAAGGELNSAITNPFFGVL